MQLLRQLFGAVNWKQCCLYIIHFIKPNQVCPIFVYSLDWYHLNNILKTTLTLDSRDLHWNKKYSSQYLSRSRVRWGNRCFLSQMTWSVSRVKRSSETTKTEPETKRRDRATCSRRHVHRLAVISWQVCSVDRLADDSIRWNICLSKALRNELRSSTTDDILLATATLPVEVN